LHGTEAVIPLKQGAVPVSLDMKNAMSPGGIGPTFAGMNEYTGYNQGPLTTDLDAIKDIAAKLGAYDASTKLITDPTTWKQILSSGIATNYDMGLAEIGTKMIPGIGADIGERIKELKDTGSGDTASALKQVTDELRTAMLEMVKNMGGGNNAQSGEQLMLLTELVREQRNANDINTRILQVSSN
jgi:Sec-independent protein translocase protein TatA